MESLRVTMEIEDALLNKKFNVQQNESLKFTTIAFN